HLREDGKGTIVEVEGRFMPRNAVLGFLIGGAASAAVRRALDESLREVAAFVEAESDDASPSSTRQET
ncbi:MAG TPA: hypothetical protein VGN32_10040, partial [Ktedonobacterales bacterium]|nr:hypothetical protein [Ktedonobacterales bacterium]